MPDVLVAVTVSVVVVVTSGLSTTVDVLTTPEIVVEFASVV